MHKQICLECHGMKMGLAMRLVKFTKECKEKKKCTFSTYRSLKEVLVKYDIKSSSITSISQFEPVSRHIDEENLAFKFCIEDILYEIKNMGPVIDSNEAMRYKCISTIFYTTISILESLVILSQMEVSSEESSGCVDYAIKRVIDNLLEEIICIMKGKQNLPGIGIAQNLIQCKSSCEINLNMLKKKRTADEAFEEYEYIYGIVMTDTLKNSTDLRNNVKRILEVIVCLLKDMVSVSEEPLLAPSYNLLSGPAGAIALLIKELICKVQVTESLYELEKSEKKSFQEKNDLQTTKATYANEPQNPISTSEESFQEKNDLQTAEATYTNEPQNPILTSEESFQEINLQSVEVTNSQNPISTSEKIFQEINLQLAKATNSQNHIRFLSSEINTHLSENASQKLHYYGPTKGSVLTKKKKQSADSLSSTQAVISEGISCLVAFYHFGEKKGGMRFHLTSCMLEGKKKQMPQFIRKVQRRKIAKVAKMFTKQVVVKNELEILFAKQEAMKKELEILFTKKDVVKKELEVAQDSVILGAYHHIDDYYKNYHKASTLLLKRKLFEN
ncbi:3996_t:CDS:10, partial [Funneliformis caledonium]